jgi:protein SCO1/2
VREARSPIVRNAAIGLVLACIAVALVRIFAPSGPAAPDFTLTDQDGRPYVLSAQRGRPIALFFGYTHCPDVCPTTLQALALAKRKLGAAGQAFDVALVTVDPKRDTPAVLGRYVRLFDPGFSGLTGSAAELAPVYAAYHIEHEIEPATKDSAAGYTVAHSSVVQFISPGGRLRGTGNFSDTADEFAVLMRQAAS